MADSAKNLTEPVVTVREPKPAQLQLVSQPPLGVPSPLVAALEVTSGTLNVLEGQPGGIPATVFGTLLRAGLIAGGFYLVGGVKDWKRLTFGSLAASGAVTLVCFAGHAVLRRRDA